MNTRTAGRKETIQLKNIGTNSSQFANRLRAANLFQSGINEAPTVSRDLAQLTVEFTGIRPSDKLQLEDIATLALIIRALATAGCQVTIILPRKYQDQPSRIHRLLDRCGFLALFRPTDSSVPWQSNIHIKGDQHYLAHWSPQDADASNSHYVPMAWFTRSAFSRTSGGNLWKVRPTVSQDVERRLRNILQTNGIADADTIDTLAKTMFLELGWNTILHSGAVPGDAIGLFCAQVNYWHDSHQRFLPRTLTFCTADIGRGIPNTLRTSYWNPKNQNRRYHEIHNCSEETGIILYAFDEESTSRPDFPSYLDADGPRGLAYVAKALQDTGSVRVRSLGGELTLKGTPDGVEPVLPSTKPTNIPTIIGTQVIGTLQLEHVDTELTSAVPPLFKLPESTHFCLACDLGANALSIATEADTRDYFAQISPNINAVLLDLGYADEGPRSIEYLCKIAHSIHPATRLVLWNVRTSWHQLIQLHLWVADQLQSGMFPPLCVHSERECRFLGINKESLAQLETIHPKTYNLIRPLIDDQNQASDNIGPIRLRIPSVDYVRLTNEVNSRYLNAGFEGAESPTQRQSALANGFFSGRIHLLKGGECVARYFSLTQNITNHPGNLRRWAESFYAAVSRFLERRPTADDELVLIGFTATVREILSEVAIRLNRPCRAFALLTYDVPTREEISSKLRRGDKVLLLTDVISTGTLVEAVYGLVTRVGAEVLGIVSLVDTRWMSPEAEGSIEFARAVIPHITSGQLRTHAPEQMELGEQEFWVDPVSLIPSQEKAWGWGVETQQKIETTLDLISSADAVVCGHIVNGTRHSSVYVNLYKLLQHQDLPVFEQVRNVCTSRLLERDWTDFAPTIVLYPSGVSRIEVINPASVSNSGDWELSTYQTAVRCYAECLDRIWPGMTQIEVPRAFDPGGGSRCARSVVVPDDIRGPFVDIVVADDGMWRGTTVRAISQIALALGALRVLVVPLLARLLPLEAEHLEMLSSIQSRATGRSAQLCYAFPLVLPIPYYAEHECPYEITIKRLTDRQGSNTTITKIATKVLHEIRGRSIADYSEQSRLYCETWLRLRAYAELATEHQAALEKLKMLIDTLSEEDELLATFRLFAEEWRLLGRARLRQTVRISLRNRAREAATDRQVDEAVRIAAVTVLRSLFRNDFIVALPHLAPLVAGNLDLLSRVVMHIATLPDDLRACEECVQFLEEISEIGPVELDEHSLSLEDPEAVTAFDIFATCKMLSIRSIAGHSHQELTIRNCVRKLLNVLEHDAAFKHNTRLFVDMLGESAESIREFAAPTFEAFFRSWHDEHEPRLVNEVLPYLQGASRLLLRTYTRGFRIPGPEVKFLENRCESIIDDIVGISGSLHGLRRPGSRRGIDERLAVECAASLTQAVLSSESETMKLFRVLRGQTAHDVIQKYFADVTSRFAAKGLDVQIALDGISSIDDTLVILVPPDVVSACLGNVLNNLISYAFPDGSKDPRIAILVSEYTSHEAESMIQVEIRNNGTPIHGVPLIGKGGRRSKADLETFGGHYFSPRGTEELPWRVVQRIDFPTITNI